MEEKEWMHVTAVEDVNELDRFLKELDVDELIQVLAVGTEYTVIWKSEDEDDERAW